MRSRCRVPTRALIWAVTIERRETEQLLLGSVIAKSESYRRGVDPPSVSGCLKGEEVCPSLGNPEADGHEPRRGGEVRKGLAKWGGKKHK